MPLGDRAGAGLRDEPAEREVAERGLIALAEQIEQRGALREVVIGVRAVGGLGVQRPRSRRYSPHAAGATFGSRTSAAVASRCSASARRFAAVSASAAMSVAWSASNGGAPACRISSTRATASSTRCASQREPRAEHAHRPFVPLARLPAVGAVGFARAGEELARRIVAAADQVNLRERVEDGAGRLVELDRAAHVERAVQRVLGARQIAEPDADLPERGERDREPVAGAVRFVQRDAALGQRERLLVPVLQHHHVRLVAAHCGEHVVGLHHRRKALGVAQRRHAPRRSVPSCASEMLESEWTSARWRRSPAA